MNKGLLTIALATAILLIHHPLPASPPLTLDPGHAYTFDELLALGQAHNTGLRESALAVEGLQWERLEAWGRLMPTLTAGSSYGRSERNVITYEDANGEVKELPDAQTYRATSSHLSLNLRQTLFAGFANTAAVRRALLARQDVLGEDSRQQQQFRHDLSKTAHAVLASQSRQATEQTLLEDRLRQLELARMRLQVGKGTELEVLQMEIDVGRQQVNVAAADQDLRSSWDALSLLLGAEPGPPGRLEMDFEVFQPAWRQEALINEALDSREEVQRGRRSLEQARLQTVEARAGFMPSLNLQLGHSRSEQRSEPEAWKPFPRNYDNSAAHSLQLPLFQGFATVNAWQSSRINERRLALAHDQLEREVRAQIREAVLRLEAAWSQSRMTESNLELARRSLALERERYRLGLASLLQVQSAEATWHQAENDHLAQRLAFRDRLAELELAVGRDLTR
jgi:outer membrane protein